MRPSRAFHSRGAVAAEDRAQRIDRRLPQVRPRSVRTDHKRHLKCEPVAGQRARGGDLVADLLLVPAGGRRGRRGHVEHVRAARIVRPNHRPDGDFRRGGVALGRPYRHERPPRPRGQFRDQREQVVVQVVQRKQRYRRWQANVEAQRQRRGRGRVCGDSRADLIDKMPPTAPGPASRLRPSSPPLARPTAHGNGLGGGRRRPVARAEIISRHRQSAPA
jgi:hypothetical protein